MPILNVGIDISLKTATCALLTQEDIYLEKPFEVPNKPEGFKKLHDTIAHHLENHHFSRIRIGLEATGMYGHHLMDYYAQSNLKQDGLLQLYQINPKYIKRFKGSFPEKDKTDLNDAQYVAEYLKFGKLPVEYQPDKMYLPLQRLVRYRYHLVKIIEREKKLFLANLFLKFPGWVQDRPITNLGRTSLQVITEFSLDELAHMSLEDLALVVAKAGKNRSPDPQSIAEEIQKAARESHRIRPALAASVTIVLASIVANLTALAKSLKAMDKAIQQQVQGISNPLLSIKGIGPVYSAGILAALGDVSRFKSHNQVARLAGLTWKRNQSANFEAEEKHLMRECDKYLRYYLVEAANSLRMHNDLYRAFYHKKYQEVTRHQHKRALVLTARKLVRLVFALLVKNQLYDPQRNTWHSKLTDPDYQRANV
jgi:transposase